MALTSMTVTDEEIFISVDFNGGLTSANAYDFVSGLTATGHAKHNSEDTYNWEVGFDLAVARAKARLYNKIAKQIVKNTYV